MQSQPEAWSDSCRFEERICCQRYLYSLNLFGLPPSTQLWLLFAERQGRKWRKSGILAIRSASSVNMMRTLSHGILQVKTIWCIRTVWDKTVDLNIITTLIILTSRAACIMVGPVAIIKHEIAQLVTVDPAIIAKQFIELKAAPRSEIKHNSCRK